MSLIESMRYETVKLEREEPTMEHYFWLTTSVGLPILLRLNSPLLIENVPISACCSEWLILRNSEGDDLSFKHVAGGESEYRKLFLPHLVKPTMEILKSTVLCGTCGTPVSNPTNVPSIVPLGAQADETREAERLENYYFRSLQLEHDVFEAQIYARSLIEEVLTLASSLSAMAMGNPRGAPKMFEEACAKFSV